MDIKVKAKTCKACRDRVCMPAFSSGFCVRCNTVVLCVNTPADAVCINCAEKHNLCRHCGKEFAEE